MRHLCPALRHALAAPSACSTLDAYTHIHVLTCMCTRRTFNSLSTTPEELAIEGGQPLKEEVRASRLKRRWPSERGDALRARGRARARKGERKKGGGGAGLGAGYELLALVV